MNEFQFTHPGKGATLHALTALLSLWSFNSRTLGRVRPLANFGIFFAEDVSIHAPWEGCDRSPASQSQTPQSFNSRTLGRVRHGSHRTQAEIQRFNSRTLGRVRLAMEVVLLNLRGFNSRTLGRVRRIVLKTSRRAWSFNSRTLGRVRQLYPT